MKLNSPILAAVAAFAGAALFVVLRLAYFNMDASRFVVAGEKFCDHSATPSSLTVFPSSAGYDGQFNYRLALTPFTREATENGITLDIPALRQTRIVYPLLSRALSLGNPERLPAAMIFVNLLAIAAVAGLAGALAKSAGGHATWGLLAGLYPGFLFSTARLLAEPVEAAFCLGAVVCLMRNRPVAATLLLTAAVLTKETSLAVAATLAALSVIDLTRPPADGARVPVYVGLAPIAALAGWTAVVRGWWDAPWSQFLGRTFGLPFEGLANAAQLPNAFLMIGLAVVMVVAAALSFEGASTGRIVKALFAGAAVYAALIPPMYWIDDWNAWRSLSLTLLFASLVVAGGAPNLRRGVMAGLAIAWLLSFGRLIREI